MGLVTGAPVQIVPSLGAPVTTRKIAIVGFADTCWPPEAVWADPAIEKWTLNHGHRIDPRWDRLFEFHGREVITEESAKHFRGVDQWAVLSAETRRPIYMMFQHDEVPNSVMFPLDAFTAYFGRHCDKLAAKPYAEMAAAYMLGYAIMQLADQGPQWRCKKCGCRWRDNSDGTVSLLDVTQRSCTSCETINTTLSCVREPPPEILIYGFELFDGEEYSHQRPCFEMYAGWAMGAGITLTVPDTSCIFANRGLYGYDTGETQRLMNQANEYLSQRFKEVTTAFHLAKERNDAAVAEMQTAAGILQELERQQTYVRHLLKGGNYK